MIDFTKPVQTRDGRRVRVLCTNGEDEGRPVVGFVKGFVQPMTWPMHGIFSSSLGGSLNDLVNVPERVELWLNTYPGNVGSVNSSRKNADESVDGSARRTGVIRITYEDGKPVAVALEAV